MKYVATLMDPPWNENGGGMKGANRHYGLMKHDQILSEILGSGSWSPAEDAHLYMWVTNTFLAQGLWLMERLDFKYKTNFPWIKAKRETIVVDGKPITKLTPENMGIGQYGRGCHELLLFGVRGKGYNACAALPDGRRTTVRTDFLAGEPREVDAKGKIVHSRKPRRQYDLIDLRTKPGSRLEMFARTRHSEAWDVWGNQAPGAPGEKEEEEEG